MTQVNIEVFSLQRDAALAIDQYKSQGFPNIVVMGPLDLIEGTSGADKGWLVLATNAEITATGSGNLQG